MMGLDPPSRIRTGYVICPKQTRMRDFLLLALRPQGVTVAEAITLDLVDSTFQAMTLMAQAEYRCGYDIRRTGKRRTRDPHAVTYYLVGKHRWNGVYHAFRDADPMWANVRNSPSKLRTP